MGAVRPWQDSEVMASKDGYYFGRVVSSSIRRGIKEGLSMVERGVRAVGHRLIGIHPALTYPVLKTWYLYVYLYIRAVGLTNAVRYEAEIEPFELHWIDPDCLEHMVFSFPKRTFKYAGQVMDGTWDQECELFEETDLYRSFEAHFERGVDWEDTSFFTRVVSEIEEGKPRWACRSREEFRERCEALDELYESIKTDGYKTQDELVSEDIEDPIKREQRISKTQRFIFDEMTISVGRNGELLFNDGRDRLAIAKVLELDAVPVWILVRHSQWQQFRDAVATGEIARDELPEELQSHPDIQNIAGSDA